MLLLFKQGMREICGSSTPAQVPIKVGGGHAVPTVVDAVWGFFADYVRPSPDMLLASAGDREWTQVTAFSAVARA